MDKIVIFTDADLDGACSYLCVKWLLGRNVEYHATTVKKFRNDWNHWLQSNDPKMFKKILILDIDVSKYVDLIDLPNVVVVDHHFTHNPSVYKHCTKIVSVTTSNVKLLRQTLLKNVVLTAEQEELINIVDDYDCYKIANTKSIPLNFVFWGYKGDRIKQFIQDFDKGFNGFTTFQLNLASFATKRLKEHLDNSIIYYNDNGTYSIGAIVGDFAINEIAHFTLNKVKCDVCIVVNSGLRKLYVRKNKTSKVNVFEVVRDITGKPGEGHEFACGGEMTDMFINYTKSLQPYEHSK